MADLETLSDALDAVTAFRDERDWAQYHTPRHLASAISIEAAELQENLLWKSDQEVEALLEAPEGREKVADEIGDVLILALLFCQQVGIDPLTAIDRKLKENRQKYPVNLSRGRSTKYTEL